MKIKEIIKRISCKHNNQECLTNVYGDYITCLSSGKKIYRSIWKCSDCGKIIMSEILNEKCEYKNWRK